MQLGDAGMAQRRAVVAEQPAGRGIGIQHAVLRRVDHQHGLRRALENRVGLINGLGFALILGLVTAAWFQIADLGLVIGLAMICVLTAAALGGIAVPLTLDRFGVDPAVASGPFVTTMTDVIGFFTFLGIATWWFALR